MEVGSSLMMSGSVYVLAFHNNDHALFVNDECEGDVINRLGESSSTKVEHAQIDIVLPSCLSILKTVRWLLMRAC